MNRLQSRIAGLWLVFCCSVAVLNLINYGVFSPPGFPRAFLIPSVWILPLVGIGGFWAMSQPTQWSKVATGGIPVVLGGPVLYVNGPDSFVGLWLLVVGLVLFYKLGVLKVRTLQKLGGFAAWALVWIYLAVVKRFDDTAFLVAVNYFLFFATSLVTIYALFEEEILDLLASNQSKDLELAEKTATIARLEPLSVLGERVAHVVHSFKNNLNLLSTADLYLEQGDDPEKARAKVQEFSRLMTERIDNILMVSRAGIDLNPEIFDASRVLSGLYQVYLSEPSFVKHARVTLEAPEPTLVNAVRWDFLLMTENILKNALEALIASEHYGEIRITLKDRRLTVANDGGPMPACGDCQDPCLDCQRYGIPGKTTKAGGSGHGLTQVFSTCRKYGWALQVRVEGDWTVFELDLTKP